MKLLIVAGARPNFMKIAPLIRQLRAKREEQGTGGNSVPSALCPMLEYKIIHTGQHCDAEMSQVFSDELKALNFDGGVMELIPTTIHATSRST